MKIKNILLKTAGLLLLASFVLSCLAAASYFFLAGRNIASAAVSSNTNQTAIDSRAGFLMTRIKQLNSDIFKYNSDPAKKNSLISFASERKSLAKELMKKNPRLFLAVAIKASQKSGLSSSIQSYIEQETTLTSKIEVKHTDDFSNPKNSRFDYFLTSGGIKINYYPTQNLYLSSGAVIRTTGFKLDDVFVSDASKKNFTVTQKAPQPESVGDQKTLVILLDFLNSGPHPFTDDEAYDMVFKDQFQSFYKEQSYNNVSFSGEVVDWYKLQRNSQGFGCEGVTESELEKIVNERNINLADYKRLIVLPNNQAGGGWSTVGTMDWLVNNNIYRLSEACVGLNMFDYDSGGKPFSWTSFDYVTSHEMGHSLGVWHANGWDCQDKILYGNCQHLEYGNYYDTMGHGDSSLHFNALYKDLLGWIKPDRELKIKESGNYTLKPLENDKGHNIAKIFQLNSANTPFYLEYRKALGFDSNLKNKDLSNQNGLFINNVVKNGTDPFSRLLDISPTTDDWYIDTQKTTLNSGYVFDDPGTGITISSVSNATDKSIDFKVAIKEPVCIRNQPGVTYEIYSFYNNVGGSGFIFNQFQNLDSNTCNDESEFNLIVTESPWEIEIIPPENFKLFPGEIGGKTMNYTIPNDISPGEYSIKYDVVNLTGGLKTSRTVTIKVNEALSILDITPSSGPVETVVKIRGTGFNQDNMVHFQSNDGYYYSNFNYYEGEKVTNFTIPKEITIYSCDPNKSLCQIPTSGGQYTLQISSYGASSNIVNFEVTNSATSTSNLKITKVTGPDKLKIGELGSWTIEATDNNNRPLSFSAIWGDEGTTGGAAKGAPKFNPTSTGAILTHIYYISGKFQPIFTVKNDLGEQTSTTTAVYVESTPGIATITTSSSSFGNGLGAPVISSEKCDFYRDLWLGSRGADVSCLQRYLITGGFFPKNETVTGYFGGITQSAVSKWQAKNYIAPAVGYFGTVSRNKYYSLTVSSSYSTSSSSSLSFSSYATSSSSSRSSSSSSGYSSFSSSISSTKKFLIGDRVITTAALSVRASASLTGALLGTKDTSSLGTVVSGPVSSAGSYNWYYINYDLASDGWSAENYLEKISSSFSSAPPKDMGVITYSAHKGSWWTEDPMLQAYKAPEIVHYGPAQKLTKERASRFIDWYKSCAVQYNEIFGPVAGPYYNDPNISADQQIVTVAVVPNTCGAGCGAGMKVEITESLWKETASDPSDHWIVYYELGRGTSFPVYGHGDLKGKDMWTVTIPSYMSMRCGRELGGNIDTHPTYKDFYFDETEVYKKYPEITMTELYYSEYNIIEDIVRDNKTLGPADIVAAMLDDMHNKYGIQKMINFFSELSKTPEAVATQTPPETSAIQQALCNVFNSMSMKTVLDKKVAEKFAAEWKWPICNQSSSSSSASWSSSNSTSQGGTSFSSSSQTSSKISSSSSKSSSSAPLIQKYFISPRKLGGLGKVFLAGNMSADLSSSNLLHAPGDILTIVAVAEPGYVFKGWTGCDNGSSLETTYGNLDTCRVVVPNFNKTIIANFSAVSVYQSISSAASQGTSFSSVYQTSSQSSSGSFISSAPLVYRYYISPRKLGGLGKVFLAGNMSADLSSSNLLHAPGDILTIVAAAEPGYVFKGWTGCDNGSSLETTYGNLDTCRVVVPNFNKTIIANFSAVSVYQSISSTSSSVPPSPGSTSSSSSVPPSPGSTSSSSSTPPPPGSTSSSSSVPPSPGSTSSSSSSSSQTYTLSLNKKGNGKVGLASYPGVDISGKTFSLKAGTVYTIVATADSGSVFAIWTGCDSGSVIQTTNKNGDTCKITMPSSNKTVTANFISLSSSLEIDSRTASVLNSISEQLKALINSIDALLGR